LPQEKLLVPKWMGFTHNSKIRARCTTKPIAILFGLETRIDFSRRGTALPAPTGLFFVKLLNTTWKVILKALLRKAFKITFFPFWHEEMVISAPLGGANLPSLVLNLLPLTEQH